MVLTYPGLGCNFDHLATTIFSENPSLPIQGPKQLGDESERADPSPYLVAENNQNE
jgi:hypothetical protein